MTGHELLMQLQQLSSEELSLQVYSTCDYDYVHQISVDRETPTGCLRIFLD